MSDYKGFGLIGILISVAVIAIIAAGGAFLTKVDQVATTRDNSESVIQRAESIRQEIEERNQIIDDAIER